MPRIILTEHGGGATPPWEVAVPDGPPRAPGDSRTQRFDGGKIPSNRQYFATARSRGRCLLEQPCGSLVQFRGRSGRRSTGGQPRKPGLGRGRARSASGEAGSGSDRSDVRRLEALRPLGDVELHLLALRQRTEAFGLDGGVVAEDVLAAVVLGDETEALRVVEPLHGAGSHVALNSFLSCFASGRRPPGLVPELGYGGA